MTRVLLDTNVIISALLFPGSTPDQVVRLVLDEYDLVTDWIIEELRAVVLRKRPDVLPHLEERLAGIDPVIASGGTSTVSISDPADQPILDAALSGEADVLVSGDKHFLSLVLDRLNIVTA